MRKVMANSGELVGASPAPPGQVANFVNPVTHTGRNMALHTVLLFGAALCIIIRLYTRHFITHQVGLDDCKKSLSLLLLYANNTRKTDLCMLPYVSWTMKRTYGA